MIQEESFKIIGLKAENILNIETMDLKIDGKSLVISGQNGAGKSNRIDAIFMALTGHKPQKPVREGEQTGRIEVDLGKYIVVKRYTGESAYLEVRSKEGFKYTSPQGLLDTIIGDLSFDPGLFYEMKEKDQRNLLAKLVGLDFSDLENKRKEAYDKRTMVNHMAKDLQSRMNAIAVPEEDLPDQEIDLDIAMNNLSSMREQRARFHEAVRRKKETEDKIADIEEQINNLQAAVSKIKNDPVLTASLPDEVTSEDIASLEEDIRASNQLNKKIQVKKQFMNMKESFERLHSDSSEWTAMIEKIDEEKKQRISSAVYPIEGMSISDEYIVYNNIPFSQLSDGEKLSIAVAIGMKLNPKLRTIFIKKASLLDGKNIEAVMALANANGYQLFIEKVSDDKEIKIVLQ